MDDEWFEDMMLEQCLSVDELIRRLRIVQEISKKNGISDLKIAVAVTGKDGFTTPLVQVVAPSVKLKSSKKGNFLVIVATNHEEETPWRGPGIIGPDEVVKNPIMRGEK